MEVAASGVSDGGGLSGGDSRLNGSGAGGCPRNSGMSVAGIAI